MPAILYRLWSWAGRRRATIAALTVVSALLAAVALTLAGGAARTLSAPEKRGVVAGPTRKAAR